MSFITDDQNPLAQLVELKSSLALKDDTADNHDLLVELRINPDEIEEDRIGTISVEILEATLSVDFSGLKVAPKTRHGQGETGGKTRKELQRETIISTTSETDKKKSADASVGASATGPEGKAGIGGSSSKHYAETAMHRQSESVTEDFYPVRALSDDRWKVTMQDGGPLNDAFLDNDRLCEVSEVREANRKGAMTSLVAKQKHVKITLERKASVIAVPFSRNQQALMNIVIAKSLHERSGSSEYSGHLVFSQSTISDEG
ncbi:hypothetical protein [Mesorhizobium denitrificans]|uniref:Uncharacterized protein n=1 Tax=Mesorhizobium denitrificans TaxID=2294114 RepID=A0A371X3P9_9HYPH|nr:hypothetical protein [Mesorhizobium denitrificans]RFC63856.1 hypothetical protein DY251_20445 [Mesorhizobium denitrificans]